MCSLSVVPALVVRDGVVPDPAGGPLLATDAHVWGFHREGVKLRPERCDRFLEFGILAFEVFLFCFDRGEVATDTLDDAALLRYRLSQAYNELHYFIESNPPLPPARSGETDTRLVGNGGNPL
jgi:hypothetical protein